jgi:hypothetical protein
LNWLLFGLASIAASIAALVPLYLGLLWLAIMGGLANIALSWLRLRPLGAAVEWLCYQPLMGFAWCAGVVKATLLDR